MDAEIAAGPHQEVAGPDRKAIAGRAEDIFIFLWYRLLERVLLPTQHFYRGQGHDRWGVAVDAFLPNRDRVYHRTGPPTCGVTAPKAACSSDCTDQRARGAKTRSGATSTSSAPTSVTSAHAE